MVKVILNYEINTFMNAYQVESKNIMKGQMNGQVNGSETSICPTNIISQDRNSKYIL